MIQPNELRLNNWVLPVSFGSSNAVYVDSKPTQITLESFQLITEWGNDIFHPIPLTEEILLKCGFGEQELFEDENPFFVFGNFSLSTDSFTKERFYYDSDIEIKYLHQLQNLYFALTNRDLEVRL